MVKTKIIATLGPASSSATVIRNMMVAGLDVVRLNFSHGSLTEQLARITVLRGLNRKYRRHVRILGDLEGFRIRIGSLPAPIELKKRMTVYLRKESTAAGETTIPFDYQGDVKDIPVGAFIYIDDGNLALLVQERKKEWLKAKVVVAGLLKQHKGVNIPDAKLRFTQLSDKDKANIRFCVEHNIDYIAQSFVRDRDDIEQIRALLPKASKCKLIAKIENREGINNIGRIIGVSHGIMIARGDMGVSLPIYEVPVIQKEIIRKCNKAGKFVITATQMLESMVENLRPTRAEVSDVANAIIDGSDYVMLSAESAVGAYPVETVRMMNEIIKFTERYLKK